MRHSIYSFGAAILAVLTFTAFPAWAQAPEYPLTQNCSLQLSLVDGAENPVAEVNPDLILMLDLEPSTAFVKFFDVRGFGSYAATVDGTAGLGRIVIMSGQFSDKATDSNRSLETRFVAGPLRGATFILTPTHLLGGDVSGTWVDSSDPISNGTLSGSNDCFVASP
jgi:hypothetical protein